MVYQSRFDQDFGPGAKRPQAAPQPQKKKGILKRGFEVTTGALDRLSRGSQKAVGFALSPISAAITDPFLPGGYKEALQEQVKAARSFGKGGVSGALEESGAIKPATTFGGKVRNVVIDILTDPTGALTLGAGKGAKIASAGRQVTLTKKGSQALQEITAGLAKTGKFKTPTDLSLAAGDILAQKIKISPKIAKQYVDRGGVKLLGKTIIGPENSTELIGRPFVAAADKIGLRKGFVRDANLAGHFDIKRVVQGETDAAEAAIARLQDTIINKFKVSPTAARNITYAVEGGTFDSLVGQEKELAKFVYDLFQKRGREALERGMVKGLLSEYVPIIVKDPAKRSVVMGYINTVAPKFSFGNPRETFKTIKEAEKAFPGLIETDVRKLAIAYEQAFQRALAKKNILEKTAKRVGVPEQVSVPAGTTPGAQQPLFQTAGRQTVPNQQTSLRGEPLVSIPGVSELSGIRLPESVATYLKELDEVVIKDEATSKILRTYDNVQNLFKSMVTQFFPDFHVRNAMSNIFQNYMDVGLLQAVNPKWHTTAVKILRNGKPDDVVTIGKQSFRIKELRKIMEDTGVLQGIGYFDIQRPIKKTNYGRRTGRFIENEARATNFLVNLEKTGDILTSAESSKKFLFDYNDLSKFEKNFMRRLFFFYTWPKKNLLLQLETFARNPGKYTRFGPVQREFNELRTPQEEALIPQYEKDDFNVPLGTKDGKIRTLSNIDTPLGSATKMLFNPVGEAVNMLSPTVKVPLQLGTGQDYFRGKPISELNKANDIAGLRFIPGASKVLGLREEVTKDASGKEVKNYYGNPNALFALRSLPTSRFTGSLSRATDEQVPGGQRVLRGLTGLKVTESDIATSVSINANEYKKDLAKPFIDKGLIRKGDFGYFIPDSAKNNLNVNQDDYRAAVGALSILNSKQAATRQYLDSIGASAEQFPTIFSELGASKQKKLTSKQMAAFTLAALGKMDLAVSLVTPKPKKIRYKKPRKIRIPKARVAKQKRIPKIKKPKKIKVKI